MKPAIAYAVREQNRHIIQTTPEITGAEITHERADDPLRPTRYLEAEDFSYVSIHSLKLSVASAEQPDVRYVESVLSTAKENGAKSISDHLGWTRGGSIEIGHFTLPPLTEAALDAVCRNTDWLLERFAPRPFFLETIAHMFHFKGEMGESEFIRKMLKRTGAGLLLDVTNVYANGINFKFDPRDFMDEVLEEAERVQMHLSGGVLDPGTGFYFDSHSHPVPDGVWDLYEHALHRAGAKTEFVVIERDQEFPDDAGCGAEAAKASELAGTSLMQDTLKG